MLVLGEVGFGASHIEHRYLEDDDGHDKNDELDDRAEREARRTPSSFFRNLLPHYEIKIRY